LTEKQFLLAYDRKRTSTLTLDSEPGAHTGTSRQYIPGYSDSNIIFRAPTTGNDANDGLTEGAPKQTKAACDTAAGTTKKIRIIEACSLNESVSKPTEMKRGVSGTISSSTSAPVDTWTQSATPSFGLTGINKICYSPQKKLFVAVGDSGKIAYSPDADTWTQAATPSFGVDNIRDVKWIEELDVFCACGGASKIATSEDGNTWVNRSSGLFGGFEYNSITFESGTLYAFINGGYAVSRDSETWVLGALGIGNRQIYESCVFNGVTYLAGYDNTAATNTAGKIFTLSSGAFTEVSSTSFDDSPIRSIAASGSLIVAVGNSGKIGYSSNGTTWTQAATPSFGTDQIYSIVWVGEISRFVAVGGGTGKIAFSTDGDTWTQAVAPSFGADAIYSICWPVLTGRLVAAGLSGKIARSTAFVNTISANVAGFTVQAVQYSGTITAYNCTMKQPGTTANLSLNACRVTEAGSHISSNTATSFATLFEGDRYTTCTPAAQNDIDCNLDTVGGTWYIYNASATGFERVRDCLVTDGIIANFNVTVGGRANIQGDSENILIDAEVTTDDPKFVDTTDYELQFQTNGYARNSLAAGRSAIYFNSAGDPRDVGAWSYVESAVSYYFAKSVVLYKGEITHEIEETVSEQQGDSGVVSVYGNANRIKEIITISYGDTREVDRAPFEYIRLLKDKGVKLILDAEWESNAGTVTVNGNQAAGVEFLTVDSCIYYNGLWVTVSGKRYWIMRASPSNTAATKLILDRPLEDAVSDNDVLTTNYPPGVGEYQFAGLARLQLKRKAPDGLKGWQTGLQLRFVRKYQ